MNRRLNSLWMILALAACSAPEVVPQAPMPAPRTPVAEQVARGTIVVCGERYPTDAPVVSWDEAPFYDAHATGPRFSSEGPEGLRYQPSRSVTDEALGRRVAAAGWTLADLCEVVDLFVLHYDACGTSRECFRVLQDQRGLSVHFLLDLDGTIYQTLDLEGQAWHARQANPRSIGIEIAQVGAHPPHSDDVLEEWYVPDGEGERIRIPARLGDGGLRRPGFRAAPARAGRIVGAVQGNRLAQYDFTPEQYDSLVVLTASLIDLFPRIAPDAPRDAAGRVRSDVLTREEFEAFSGILGHLHVSEDKVDPGPAFDWETYLERVRERVLDQRP